MKEAFGSASDELECQGNTSESGLGRKCEWHLRTPKPRAADDNSCASQVRVGVRNTIVRLTGLVSTGTEKEAAERDAWCVFGVDNVINEIEVRP